MNRIVAVFRRNIMLKLVAFLCALLLWVFVTVGQPDAEVPKKVTVILVNLPDDMVRVSDVPAQLDITVSGTTNVVRSIRDEDLIYEVDVSNVAQGQNSFKVVPSRIKGLPSGVTVSSVSPTQFNISFDERLNDTLPVSIIIKGKPAEGYELGDKVAEPSMVEVSGAAGEVNRMKFVPTEPIDVSGKRTTLKKTAALDLAGQHVDLVQTRDVEVMIEIRSRTIKKRFEHVGIVVTNTEHEVSVKPEALSFDLQGPENMLNSLTEKDVRLVVDATGKEIGTFTVRPKIQLPDQSFVVQVSLPEVTVTLKKSKKKKQTSPLKSIH